jgi:1-acyl-sn-glycerol-3-phosphate acyltransferase
MVGVGGLRAALSDLAGALVPLGARGVQRSLEERLATVPNQLNEFGFDPYGLHLETLSRSQLLPALLYRYYFRVETHGIEYVPPGRVLVIANHAGQLPFDGMMLATALLLEAEPPRIARAMGEYWIPQLPFVSVAAARGGTLVGTPENCIQMLENGECVSVFPEGERGMNKVFRDRYKLMRFGLGFMRLALATNTPIVPVGIVGSEEQQPGFARFDALGNALGMPTLPITLGFPWLGPVGILPMPVKYRLHFGRPLHFEGDPNDEDAVIEARVAQVKEAIGGLLERGIRERAGVFR